MAASKVQRVPEVVIFADPSSKTQRQLGGYTRESATKRRNIARAGDVSDFFSFRPTETKGSDPPKKASDEGLYVSVDMRSALKEVKSLSGEGLTGKERRRYEEQRAKELGGKGHKAPVMPYPMYMKGQQMLKEREQQKMEEVSGHVPVVSSCGHVPVVSSCGHVPVLRAQGMCPKKTRKPKKVVKGRGRWKDTIKGLNPHKGFGRIQNGVLTVNKGRESRMKRT